MEVKNLSPDNGMSSHLLFRSKGSVARLERLSVVRYDDKLDSLFPSLSNF
jgi:hypothetical protein